MAQAPVQTTREVLPDSKISTGGDLARATPQSASYGSIPTPQPVADVSRREQARNLEEAGAGVSRLGVFFNQAAADNAANEYQEGVTKILHGSVDENGQVIPGFMSLKGKDAIDAAPKVQKDIDTLMTKLKGGLPALSSDMQFSNYSRRFKAITDAQIGQHVDNSYKGWMTGVNKASEKLAIDQISTGAMDEDTFLAGTADLVRARVKQAQLMYGNDPTVINEAVSGAKQDALTARLNIVAVENPARAIRMLDANKSTAGARYDDLYNRFRARADQQIGREAADGALGSAGVLENGEDTKAVLRHFESYKETAYEDKSPGAKTEYRTGYGSDTVTRADGRVERVTKDTVVNKEDAERDLERRATLSQNAARRAIGDDAWGKLDGRAKASITSIAYNYGDNGIPRSVIDAAKTGDKEELAKAILGLSGHNGGVNAKRRAQEAANVRGEPTERVGKTQAEVLDQVMNDPALANNPQAQAAAIAQVNKSYMIENKRRTQEKAAFETSVQDARAEALTTGETRNPIPEGDFKRQYGESAGPVKYQEYVSDVKYGANYKAMQSMTDTEMTQYVDQQMPAPGAVGYAHAVKNADRLRKGAETLQKERREDPAGAVSRAPAVQEAFAKYDPKNPETFKPVAAARKAEQERLGIESEYQSPITKTEALKLTTPLRTMLPGQERDTLRDLGTQFQKMFGDDAEKAFSYALRAHKVDTETAQVAARISKKLALGQPIVAADAAEVDGAREGDAAGKAVGTTSADTANSYGFDTVGAMSGKQAPSVEGSPVVTPKNIPPAAIQFLLKNPGGTKEFDAKYGTGRAKEILERYKGAAATGAP